MRHLLDIDDFSTEEIRALIQSAEDIIDHPDRYAHTCAGKKLATLFFEASTRTRLSFEAAMYELGGQVLGFSMATASSTVKGESCADTIRTVGCYADIIAMRHPLAGAPLVASRASTVPIINAGDGGHNHPTQTLADLLTIYREFGRLDGLTVGLCGDLKFGRTVHSLITAMSRYPGTRFVLISPAELQLPGYVRKDVLDRDGIPYTEVRTIEEAIDSLDILYMTRVQGERFADPAEYERLKDCYILDEKRLSQAREGLRVLHPLPRVNEISVGVDSDPRACYFKQVLNGKYIRMALILKLLAEAGQDDPRPQPALRYDLTCDNPVCITSSEQGIRHAFLKKGSVYRCVYCERSYHGTKPL